MITTISSYFKNGLTIGMQIGILADAEQETNQNLVYISCQNMYTSALLKADKARNQPQQRAMFTPDQAKYLCRLEQPFMLGIPVKV